MKRVFRLLFTVLAVILLVVIVMLTVIGMFLAIYIEKKVDKEVDETLFGMVGTGSTTKLYYYEFTDRENRIGERKMLGETELFGGYRCIYVAIDQIPQNLIDAFVSIEDKRFWEHQGVDWKRTLSAGVNYFLNFSDSFGGSTITQQLIKNVTQNDEYSFQRKIQELFWALDLETKMDKKEILERYLNVINLSDGCYGVQAASHYYFNKDVSQLSLAECATIAAITNSPTYYNPIKNPSNNENRRNIILRQMLVQGYIEESEYAEALKTPIQTLPLKQESDNEIRSWYVDMVIEDVIADLMQQKGYSRPMANLLLYTGGLEIEMALEPEVQMQLESYYEKEFHFYSGQEKELPQSSMILIDPSTGDILGVVGAVGKKNANRLQNFATQTVRPAGSVIKPLSVYAPAMEKGLITWASVFDDVPVDFGKYNLNENAGTIVNPVAWPKNSPNVYRGLTNVNYAIEHSVNTVSIRVLQKLGTEESFCFLKNQLQINSLIEAQELSDGRVITDCDLAALGLGQFNFGVTLKEITAAYSIFANAGIYNTPRSYYRVLDATGGTLLSNEYHGSVVLSEENASIMTMMLQNVVENGTGKSITLSKLIDTAGKTGTTQNNQDRWFIGYTPYYICGVWYGYEYPKPISNVSANICMTLWDEVMTKLHQDILEQDSRKNEFYTSADLIEASFCKDSGMLMTQACASDPRGDRKEVGYFVKGTEPTQFCSCHIPVLYDTVYGGVADENCPSEHVKTVGMIHVIRCFPMQIYVEDAQYVWRGLEEGIPPETLSGLPFFSNLLNKDEYCGVSNNQKQYNSYCRYHYRRKEE